MNEFEKKLQQQQFKKIPGEWRREILDAAQSSPSPARSGKQNFLSTLHDHLIAFLWPNPKAWAAMAAIWVFLLVANMSTSSNPQPMANNTRPRPVEYLRALQEQQQMFVQLFDVKLPPVEPPKADRPRPRSEFITQTATA